MSLSVKVSKPEATGKVFFLLTLTAMLKCKQEAKKAVASRCNAESSSSNCESHRSAMFRQMLLHFCSKCFSYHYVSTLCSYLSSSSTSRTLQKLSIVCFPACPAAESSSKSVEDWAVELRLMCLTFCPHRLRESWVILTVKLRIPRPALQVSQWDSSKHTQMLTQMLLFPGKWHLFRPLMDTSQLYMKSSAFRKAAEFAA